MKLENLKQQIENKIKIEDLIIFVYSDTDFIAHQYINRMSEYMELEVKPVDSLEEIVSSEFDDNSTCLYVYKTDILSETIHPTRLKNVVIITKKVTSSDNISDYIVTLPKLESWQIQDYINTNIPELLNNVSDFPDRCKWNIYLINSELEKLDCFSDCNSAILAQLCKQIEFENTWYYLSKYTIFDLVNALLQRDINKIKSILKYNLDINPFALATLLYNKIKEIILVTVDQTASPEKLNMARNKFWAIKKSYSGLWSKQQLESILEFLTSIDKQVRSGKLFSDESLTDYIIIKILST